MNFYSDTPKSVWPLISALQIQTLMALPEEGFSVTIIINLQDHTSKR